MFGYTKDIKEFEEMTKPIPNIKKLGWYIKSLYIKMLPIICKTGLIKEYLYEDRVSVSLYNNYKVEGNYLLTTNQISAVIEFNVTEEHNIYQHWFYIGSRNKRWRGERVKGSKVGKVLGSRVLGWKGDEVNEDYRICRVVGTLHDVKIKLDKEHGFEDVKRINGLLVKVPIEDSYGRLNLRPLIYYKMERVINAPYGAVDEEEILNLFNTMTEHIKDELKDFNLASCIDIHSSSI